MVAYDLELAPDLNLKEWVGFVAVEGKKDMSNNENSSNKRTDKILYTQCSEIPRSRDPDMQLVSKEVYAT